MTYVGICFLNSKQTGRRTVFWHSGLQGIDVDILASIGRGYSQLPFVLALVALIGT